MRNGLTIVLATVLLTACQTLHRGDLLFHVAAQGNAITDVTPGMIDHVAICLNGDSVVEALPRQGVVITPLHTVLSREDGYYVKGKVRNADRKQSVARARQWVGAPYDSLFLEGNKAIYCSELVLLSFVDKQGWQLLKPVPMTFRDEQGHIPAYWQDFYARQKMKVPEGAPGSNPSELSQRKEVIIKKLK